MSEHSGALGLQRSLHIAVSAALLREERSRWIEAAPGRASLGASFLTLRGLAEACAAEVTPPVRCELDGTAFTRLVRRCALEIRKLAPLVTERPGFAAALGTSVRELRDAGIPPEEIHADFELRELYERVASSMTALAERGIVDRIELFRLARRGAPAWLERRGFESARVYGATELVGSAGDLLDALHARIPLKLNQPDPGDVYAAEVRTCWPWSFAAEPESPAADSSPEIRAFGLSSPRAELEFVAREILKHLERGEAPDRICVVARSLEAFSPWLPTVLERHGIPFSSTLSQPVLSRPAVRARLDLVRVLLLDLPREATVALLASPRLDWRGEVAAGGLAEVIGRRGRVRGGLADWQRALREGPELQRGASEAERGPRLQALTKTLPALANDGRRLRDARTWQARVHLADELTRAWLGPPEAADEAADGLARTALQRLSFLDEIDALTPGAGAASAAEFLQALEQALDQTSSRPQAAESSGVRVLDVLQVRALPIDHLFLLGFNHGTWPLELREDPILKPAERERLRAATGRPLTTPRLQESESRFLLKLLAAQTRRSFTLTWHERDASGRERSESTDLRLLALAEPAARMAPAAELLHPTDALADAASRLRGDPTKLLSLAEQLAPTQLALLDAGLELIGATESRTSESFEFDANVATSVLRPDRSLSPTFLEELGRCPLRAFFGRVLRVDELDSPPPLELAAGESGTVVHSVLHTVYLRLLEEGRLSAGGSAADAAVRARELLPEGIREAAGSFGERMRGEHPVLWQAFEASVTAALESFLQRDLGALLPAGIRSLSAEVRLELRWGPLRIVGKGDRIIEEESGLLRVGDYKTGSDLQPLTSPAQIQRGTRLQIPLYVLAVAQDRECKTVQGEVLPVPLRPDRALAQRRADPRTITLQEVTEWVARPLEVLQALLEKGQFPFRAGEHCRHCPYTIACRREHVASRERLKGSTIFADYFALHEAEA